MASAPLVDMPTLVAGFDEAYERLQDAFRREAKPGEVFRPLFEALHWAVAIFFFADENGITLSVDSDDRHGLRFARNRADHQWANAIEFGDVHVNAGPSIHGLRTASRRIEPVLVKDWRWVEGTRLPTGYADSPGEKAYRERLEGQQARSVLERFSTALSPLL